MEEINISLSKSLGDARIELSGATAIGPYHVQAGLPNQDAQGFVHQDDLLLLAVADGAGSLARSDEGSELAVSTAIQSAWKSLSGNQEPDIVGALARAVLDARSGLLGLDYWREAGSTLVVAALSPESFAVAALGDSFAVAEHSSGELALVQPPAVGEFANITELLGSPDPTVRICSGDLGALSGLALCSDAFEHATLEQRVPTPGFWSQIFRMARGGVLNAQELIRFMESQGKIDDDATIYGVGISSPQPSHRPFEIEDYSLAELEAIASDGSSPAVAGIPTDF